MTLVGRTIRRASRWTIFLCAVAIGAFVVFPAEAAQPPCDPPDFPGRDTYDSLRSALAGDAFAEAFEVYLHDLQEARDKDFDLYARMVHGAIKPASR